MEENAQAPLTVREAAFCERLELMPDRSRLTPGQHVQPPCSAHTCPRVASTRQVQLKGGSFYANKAWQEIKEMLQIPNPIAFIHLVNQPTRVIQPLLPKTLEMPGTAPPPRQGQAAGQIQFLSPRWERPLFPGPLSAQGH